MPENRVYSVFGSSVITVSLRWTDRAIGIVSTIILARLLVPEDFGVIAMASLVIALANVLMDLGVHVALIRNPDATQSHYDTAWSIRLLQALFSTALLVAAAPFAADYFQDWRVEPVLGVLSLSLLLGGLENIGVIDFQKNMQFGAEFRFRFLRRFVGFAVTVTIAVLMRSYWAIVIGALTGRAFGVVLSYWLHSMRPRLGFKEFKEIFSISQWLLVSNIGLYLRNNLHKILIGRWAPTATFGAYSLADDISAMPSTELLAPVNRVLFPAFTKVKQDSVKLREKFLLAQGVQTLLTVPAAVGLALIAEEVVLLLLGERWELSIRFIQVLALVNIVQALASSGSYVLIVLGRMRTRTIFIWVQVVVFSALALTVYFEGDPMTIAWLRLLVSGIGLWLLFWFVARAVAFVSIRDIVAVSLRPLIAAAVMAAGLMYPWAKFEQSLTITLFAKVILGATLYFCTLYGLWRLAGRPEGAESYVCNKFHDLVAARIRLS